MVIVLFLLLARMHLLDTRQYHLKKRPSIAPPRLLASPLALKAFVAMLEAWLNLSHREKAKVFVTVRTMAMTAKGRVSF